MKMKVRFFTLMFIAPCTVVILYMLLSSKPKNINIHQVNIKHKASKYGILCIEDNICKNDTFEKVYTYIRKSDFEHLIDKDINITKVAANIESAVPDIVHYTWYGGLNKGNLFRFHHMMAILSVQKFLKPSRIYFWHDMVPTGEYWKEVNKKVPELCLVYRKTPTEIRGRRVYVAEHITDVIRLEAVMEYGGIYFDLDVMVVKSFDSLLKYDVVMGYESPGRLCSGVIIGKPWADFLKLWHQEYSSFTISRWDYHSVDVPSKLAKQFPNLIHIEEISFHLPNWRETDLLYEVGNIYDWKRNNYACHLWIRFHNTEHNSEDIRTWNTTVGEIWRWIYYGDWRLQLPGCILDNVCKDAVNSRVFIYKRQKEFHQRADSSVNTQRKTDHLERVIPNIVHFTWYGTKKTFRFHQLISILAAHKFIQPDHILFWHDVVPQGSYWDEIKEKVPELVPVYRELPKGNWRATESDLDSLLNTIVGIEAVMEYGGIYLDFDVIVLRPLDPLFIYDVSVGYESESVLSNKTIIGKPWADFLKICHQQIKKYEAMKMALDLSGLAGALARTYPNLIHTESELMHGPTHTELHQLYTEGEFYDWRDKKYTMNLWTRHHTQNYNSEYIKYWNTTAGEIYRYIYYDDWSIVELKELKGKICIYRNICKNNLLERTWKYIRLPTFLFRLDLDYSLNATTTHSEPVVPNIVHFTWYGGLTKGNDFRFHHLLSVLAAHKFIRPDAILFWHDMEPEGPYWSEINRKVPEIKLVYRPAPTEIRHMQVNVAEHLTDIVRLEAIIEYGGFYFDLDAMVVKPLDIFRKYDVTMGYEHENGLCNGIIFAKPWADFLRIWHHKYETFDDEQWADHSVLLPAKLAKIYPTLIHTEWDTLNRPNWLEEELPMLYGLGNLYDWRSKNYAVHLWIRFHKTEHNSTDIKTWNTTVGEIFRYIYYDDWRIVH